MRCVVYSTDVTPDRWVTDTDRAKARSGWITWDAPDRRRTWLTVNTTDSHSTTADTTRTCRSCATHHTVGLHLLHSDSAAAVVTGLYQNGPKP